MLAREQLSSVLRDDQRAGGKENTMTAISDIN